MTDQTFASATELIAALDRREMSSVELTRLFFEQIERVNGEINAFVTLEPEQALASAEAADAARARGDELGPLHGLPMTIKDCFETAGMRTTVGAPELADYVPERDADAVARLRAAGAVFFGKTNVPMYTADGQSYNDVAGTTRNPWDLDRTPGGSSGGAVAALATGMTSLDLGSDIAGSVRMPASLSGVSGLMASFGVIPQRGHIPGPPGTLAPADQSSYGPLARDVDDLELALGVLAGAADADAVGWRLELPPARGAGLSDYRLRVWLDDPACPVDAEVIAVLRRAVDALSDAGAKVDEGPPPVSMSDSIRLHRMLLTGVYCTGLDDETYETLRTVAASPVADEESVGVWHARGLTMTKRDWNRLDEERHHARAKWREFFSSYDAFLSPACLCAAMEHDHSEPLEERVVIVNGEERPYWDVVSWTAPANAAGLPAGSQPAGLTAGGLPVGLQVTGPYLEDRTVLGAMKSIAGVIGGFERPPMVK